jgi:competence protein ComEC
VTALHPPRARSAVNREPAPAEPLLLRIEWGLFAAILSGGGSGTETAAARTGQPLQATLLKVSGHGSRRGSPPEFLGAIAPRLAVIPVGRNAFGQPAPEVLARLAVAGATVYRTDLDGAVDVRSDGARVWVRAPGRPGPGADLLLRGAP